MLHKTCEYPAAPLTAPLPHHPRHLAHTQSISGSTKTVNIHTVGR